MLRSRYILYSYYEDSGFKKFIYWDTKEKTFAISDKRKTIIFKWSGITFFIVSLMSIFGINLNLESHINAKFSWWLAIIIPLIILIFFKISFFIQNNKEQDFYPINECF